MALATRPIVTFPNTGFGDIVITIEYDTVALVVSGVICVNPTPNNVFATVTRESDGRVASKLFGPGTTRLDIPTTGPNRVIVSFNSRGGLDGYAAGGTYPA